MVRLIEIAVSRESSSVAAATNIIGASYRTWLPCFARKESKLRPWSDCTAAALLQAALLQTAALETMVAKSFSKRFECRDDCWIPADLWLRLEMRGSVRCGE